MSNRVSIDTMQLLLEVFGSLQKDLCPMHPEWFSSSKYIGPTYSKAGPYTFKRLYQLDTFFKRVVPSGEADRLKADSIKAFLSFQREVLGPKEHEITRRVLEHARQIVDDVLGPLDLDELFSSCAFGKKAAFGLTSSSSYLDNRVDVLSYSGTQLEWLKAVCNTDIRLHRCLRKSIKTALCTTSLNVVAVPKNSTACRVIVPDTIVGGFLSQGLGAMIRKRLLKVGIDISHAQERHRNLALIASRDGYNSTLDLSKASDSFTLAHLERLLSPQWYNCCCMLRTPYISYEGEVHALQSCLMMGAGHTFPMQTLLFYAMVRSVVELSGSKSTVSVYGDDIIVPSRFAERTITALELCGFKLNREKSFWTGAFRESCGGDYHTGVDVRPFRPEHECCVCTNANDVLALIHSIYNGLISRWSLYEIPRTVITLLRLAQRFSKRALSYAPPNLEDSAGFKEIPPGLESLFTRPKYHYGTTLFRVLVRKGEIREIRDGHAYFWSWLRSSKSGKIVVDPYEPEHPFGCFGVEGRKGTVPCFTWAYV